MLCERFELEGLWCGSRSLAVHYLVDIVGVVALLAFDRPSPA